MPEPYIDLPGAFVSFFSGTGVAQGQTDDDPALETLYRAYLNGRRINRGRGYTLMVTIETIAVLDRVRDYAEACVVANADTISAGRDGIPEEVQSARIETNAARLVITRCDALERNWPHE